MSEAAGGWEQQRCPPQPGQSPPLSARALDGLLRVLAQPSGAAELSEEQQRAREEWERVEERQRDPGRPPAPPISFPEALQFFQASPPPPSRVGGQGLSPPLLLLRCLWGPPRLQPQLRGQRDLVLGLARCALDDGEVVHMRILQTIYQQLTQSQWGCPRYGEHWEELGFQGSDPGRDLRGVGMLGLLQLLSLLTDPQTLPLAHHIFRLSHHETQSFPFCLMSLNITRIVLQALREGRLNRECNRRQQLLPLLNLLHAAAFLQLQRLWTAQGATIADTGDILRELEFSTKKNPRQLLRSLERHGRQSPPRHLPRRTRGGQEVNFTPLQLL
ncbi:ELMO domain-containing protein 3 isoform X2 [Heliangelus exortis]|uniref:ELMO domain-containing protein 3 isoform X2 n=1 Tax=Heliangelus exortis TaxID=472823 RepID=UPI003A8EF9B2